MYIDQADRDVIGICNRNHRLNTEVTRTVGVFVPMEEARNIAVERAIRKRKHGELLGAAMKGIAVLSLIAMTVMAVAG